MRETSLVEIKTKSPQEDAAGIQIIMIPVFYHQLPTMIPNTTFDDTVKDFQTNAFKPFNCLCGQEKANILP